MKTPFDGLRGRIADWFRNQVLPSGALVAVIVTLVAIGICVGLIVGFGLGTLAGLML